MKDTLLSMTALLAAMTFNSCRDDAPSKETPLNPGDAIQFGATLPDEKTTRTYYGEETDGPNGRVWPIYWNCGEVKDEIFIYSPDALEEHNQASYRIHTSDAQCNSASEIKESTPGVNIQAGENTDKNYSFYALYPASAVKGTSAGSTISGTLSSRQQVSSAGATEGGPTKTLPDMGNCLMTGTSGEVTLSQEKKVGIRFQPLATALDITLNGPVDDTPVQVASVVITATDGGYLAGDFRYDFSQKKMTVVQETASKSVTVSIGTDGNGVTLGKGETLNLQAFVLPDADVDRLTVKVMDTEYHCWKKTLTLTEEGIVGSGRVLKVQLDKLNVAKATTDYSSWMSQLNPNTYISDISLPGAALSFNTTKGLPDNNTRSLNRTQYTDLNGLYNAGVRVYQTYIKFNPTAISKADGKIGAFYITTENGTAIYDPKNTSQPLELDNVFSDLVNHMQGDEFCVLILCEHNIDRDTSGKAVSLSTVYGRLNEITNSTAYIDHLVTGLSPEATLEDVKGKIMLVYQLDTHDSNMVDVEQLTDNLNEWVPLNGSNMTFYDFIDSTCGEPSYSPFLFGSVGSSIIYTGSATADSPKISSDVMESWRSLMWYAAYKKYSTSIWSTNDKVYPPQHFWSNKGSVDLTANPGDIIKNGVWFIYGMAFNAGSSGNLSQVKKNIPKMIDCIVQNYDKESTRNRYFMICCGGYPSGELVPMTNELNKIWIDNMSGLNDAPYGWVLLNGIGDSTTLYNQSTREIITAIINHNRPKTAGDFHPGVKGAR